MQFHSDSKRLNTTENNYETYKESITSQRGALANHFIDARTKADYLCTSNHCQSFQPKSNNHKKSVWDRRAVK